jgi:hypothetical protein
VNARLDAHVERHAGWTAPDRRPRRRTYASARSCIPSAIARSSSAPASTDP